MDPDLVRQHIESLRRRSAAAGRAPDVAERLAVECWPGGSADRTEPAALRWVRRWRPVRVGISPPVCSCMTGRCVLCN